MVGAGVQHVSPLNGDPTVTALGYGLIAGGIGKVTSHGMDGSGCPALNGRQLGFIGVRAGGMWDGRLVRRAVLS